MILILFLLKESKNSSRKCGRVWTAHAIELNSPDQWTMDEDLKNLIQISFSTFLGWFYFKHLHCRWSGLFGLCLICERMWSKCVVKSPVMCLTSYLCPMGRFTRHASGKCNVHNSSVIAMNDFLRTTKVTRQQTVPIDQQLNNLLREQTSRNREICHLWLQ